MTDKFRSLTSRYELLLVILIDNFDVHPNNYG